MEVVDYPAPAAQGLVSGAVSLVSLALLVRVLGWGSAAQDAAAFLLASSATFVALSAPLWREFRGVMGAVAAGEPYVERAGGGGPRAAYWALVLMAAILGPFLLSAYLRPGMWFGVVLGLAMGFSSSQGAFILRVRGWERANGVRLERYTVTRGGGGARVVVERGVRARR
jgi:hypothetical protein